MSAIARLRSEFVAASPQPELRVLAASGQLGYGIPEAAFLSGLERKPHVIAADMGSIDPGPAYLGSGQMASTPEMSRRDLDMVLTAARQLDVPLLIGSAGTAGTNGQLDGVLELVRRIAKQQNLHFKLASIEADMPRARINRAVESGETKPIGAIAPLTSDAVSASSHIVGQMGTEAFLRALDLDADVIIAGRACDTAPFAAVPIFLGFPIGPALHMAKIIECSSLCCVPGGRDAMLGTLDETGFTLESMNPDRRATPRSVAAHSLYEQADPFCVAEPDGVLHLDAAHYGAVDDRRVYVQGARWVEAQRKSVKIEGAERLGERVVLLASAADARFIKRIDALLIEVEDIARRLIPPKPQTPYQVHFRQYGLDGVVDWPEPPSELPREMFLLGECVAESADEARNVLAVIRQHLLHYGFDGRISTGGNLAFPLTPAELDAGTAYRFNIYHVMQLDDAAEFKTLFPVRLETL